MVLMVWVSILWPNGSVQESILESSDKNLTKTVFKILARFDYFCNLFPALAYLISTLTFHSFHLNLTISSTSSLSNYSYNFVRERAQFDLLSSSNNFGSKFFLLELPFSLLSSICEGCFIGTIIQQ